MRPVLRWLLLDCEVYNTNACGGIYLRLTKYLSNLSICEYLAPLPRANGEETHRKETCMSKKVHKSTVTSLGSFNGLMFFFIKSNVGMNKSCTGLVTDN